MLKQSLSVKEAVWASESSMCGALSLSSQFQDLTPAWCLMNGLKNKLHFPGAEGGAVPLLPLLFPSGCSLSRPLEEARCPAPLGAGSLRVSLTRRWPCLGATHFGEVMRCCMKACSLQALLTCNTVAHLQCLFFLPYFPSVS